MKLKRKVVAKKEDPWATLVRMFNSLGYHPDDVYGFDPGTYADATYGHAPYRFVMCFRAGSISFEVNSEGKLVWAVAERKPNGNGGYLEEWSIDFEKQPKTKKEIKK